LSARRDRAKQFRANADRPSRRTLINTARRERVVGYRIWGRRHDIRSAGGTERPRFRHVRTRVEPEARRATYEEAQTMWALLLILITSWGVAMNADLRFSTEKECQAAARQITEDISRGGGQFRPHWSCVQQQVAR
jgi:hypothetical protein